MKLCLLIVIIMFFGIYIRRSNLCGYNTFMTKLAMHGLDIENE